MVSVIAAKAASADLKVVNVNIFGDIINGGAFDIDAEIVNQGGASGSGTATFKVDGGSIGTVDTDTIPVNGTERISKSHTLNDTDSHTIEVTI